MKDYYYGRIVGCELYKSDVVVKREGLAKGPKAVPRGAVTMFTRASRARLAFVASNTDVTFRTMVTLTYPAEYPSDGPTVKAHLRTFLTWIQAETGGCDYLWFLEFQARGAPHIHILVDWPLPRDRQNKVLWYAKVAKKWYNIVGSQDAKHLAAGTRTETLKATDGGARYAVKYAQKMRQKCVPKGFQHCGRFWGHSRNVKPKPRAVYRCTEDDIRGALEGWKYEPAEDQAVWRVLYNQAEWFEKYIKGEVDRNEKEE